MFRVQLADPWHKMPDSVKFPTQCEKGVFRFKICASEGGRVALPLNASWFDRGPHTFKVRWYVVFLSVPVPERRDLVAEPLCVLQNARNS